MRLNNPSSNQAVPVGSFPNAPILPLWSVIQRANNAHAPEKTGIMFGETLWLELLALINKRAPNGMAQTATIGAS